MTFLFEFKFYYCIQLNERIRGHEPGKGWVCRGGVTGGVRERRMGGVGDEINIILC